MGTSNHGNTDRVEIPQYTKAPDWHDEHKEHSTPLLSTGTRTANTVSNYPRTCLEDHADTNKLDAATGWASCCCCIGWIVNSVSTSSTVAAASGLWATGFGFAAFLSNSVEKKKRFTELNQRMDQGFNGLNQRLDGLNQRLDGLNQRLDGIEASLKKIEQHLCIH